MTAPKGRRALVTGAAGFVGSQLAEALAGEGWDVLAVDSFDPYYDVSQKRANSLALVGVAGIELRECDLLAADLEDLLTGIDVVFHQAGQPGVRASWDHFDSYVSANITLTQRLLEAARVTKPSKFVYASSSSIYGDADRHPTDEDVVPSPKSPYGVTKLAAEHLCNVYAHNWDVPTVALRYFTVYGPRQRPDMAMHRLVEAALAGSPFPLFGNGEQVRDFTFVADVVAANMLVALAPVTPGAVYNVAGGGSHTMLEVIECVSRLVDAPVTIDRRPVEAGDVVRTGGSTARLRAELGWAPQVELEEGLSLQVAWHRDRHLRR